MLSGALFANGIIGFSFLPGVIKTNSLSVVSRISVNPYLSLFPVACAFLSFELFDRFNPFSAIPLILGVGCIVTISYKKAHTLTLPLWFAKLVSRFGVLGVCTLLFSGYCMLIREMST